MSSTNRGYQRHKDDFYVTPQKHIMKFLNEFSKTYPIKEFKSILDPCAGGSEKYPMSYPKALIDFGIDKSVIITNDIRENSLASFKCNYLETSFKHLEPELIISNPPFNLAKDFIRKAFKDINKFYYEQGIIDYSERGVIVFFLRYSFLASQERFEFFKEYMPTEIYLHHNRPSFIPEDIIREDGKILKAGSTDSTEYAHFVWNVNKMGDSYTRLYLI